MPRTSSTASSCARRARQRAGFTFVEVLCALLLTALLGTAVVMGVGSAGKVYQESQATSQADMLANTIDNALSDPLRFLSKNGADAVVTYNGVSIKKPVLVAASFEGESEDVLYFQSASDSSKYVRLLNEGAYGDCTVEVDNSDISTDNAEVEITITYSGNDTLKRSHTFQYKPRIGVQKL